MVVVVVLYLKKPIFPFLRNKFYIVLLMLFFHLVDPLFIWHYNRSKNSTLLLVFADLGADCNKQFFIFFIFVCILYYFNTSQTCTQANSRTLYSNRYLLHILCRKKRCSYQYCRVSFGR